MDPLGKVLDQACTGSNRLVDPLAKVLDQPFIGLDLDGFIFVNLGSVIGSERLMAHLDQACIGLDLFFFFSLLLT